MSTATATAARKSSRPAPATPVAATPVATPAPDLAWEAFGVVLDLYRRADAAARAAKAAGDDDGRDRLDLVAEAMGLALNSLTGTVGRWDDSLSMTVAAADGYLVVTRTLTPEERNDAVSGTLTPGQYLIVVERAAVPDGGSAVA